MTSRRRKGAYALGRGPSRSPRIDRPARHGFTLTGGRGADLARVFGGSPSFLAIRVSVSLPSPCASLLTAALWVSDGLAAGCGRQVGLGRGGERGKRQRRREANPDRLAHPSSASQCLT